MLATLHGLIDWLPVGLPAFLFVITLVVFFHELGHFAVARLFGVQVETFSIGFGPAIAQWRDRRGTIWKLSWVPLGGYVKFLGDAGAASEPDRELIDNMSEEERRRAFPFKPLYQRALVVAAGPIANFVLALVVFTGLVMAVGEVVTPAVVGQVKPNTAAAAAGIKPGDTIKAIDNQPITTFEDLQRIVSLNNGDALAIVLQRQGATLTLHAAPRLTQEQDRFGNTYKVPILGISARPNGSQVMHLGPLAALGRAAGEIRYVVDTVFNFRVQLVRGRADSSQISGPLGIMKMSGDVASVSFLALLNLAALISVSIGLLNLFPIPILDGGHLLYYGIEAVLGRPMSARAQDVGFRLGLALVLGLFFLATWNDLVRLKLF